MPTPIFCKWGVFMRKIFFVFLFTILFLPVVAQADGMTTKLPPPPTGVENYVIGYMPNLGVYRLGSTNHTGDIYIRSSGQLIDSQRNLIFFDDRYDLINGNWVFYSSGEIWSGWYDHDNFTEEEGKFIIFSSNNFYGKRGQLLAAASDEDVFSSGLTLIGKFISSSSLLLFLFAPFRKLVLPVLICIVLIFAFRLAWGWLRATLSSI